MGYLGRRIGLSQDQGDSNPGAANGAVGGGLLDLFAHGYFERQGDIYNAPGIVLPDTGLTATGGIISDYTDSGFVYRSHVFTASGTFDVTALGSYAANVEYLVIAGGGGGGGGYYGGGGGAGGLRTNLSGHPLATGNPSFTVTAGPTSYTVTVGAGGALGPYGSGPDNDRGEPAGQGADSYFGPPSAPQGITSKGGGKGMGRNTSISAETNGYPGGSGGGIAYRGPDVGYGYNPSTPSPIVPNIPSSHPYGITQGNPGGAAPGSLFGSGGGGAGGAGDAATGPPIYGANGGAGLQVAIAGPTATTFTGVGAKNPSNNQYQYFAGGGAGGANGPTIRTGGVGGGGNSATSLADNDAESGLSGTGGGGGGGSSNPNPSPGTGGAGGSGIVIVRYKIAVDATGSAKATGGSVSFYGGKTIHTFTHSGQFETTTAIPTAEVLIVGGGGGGAGGNGGSGGGGAGGIAHVPSGLAFTSPQTYTVSVGGGGLAGGYTNVSGHKGTQTTLSGPNITTITADGGGYGGGWTSTPGGPGGSGGGAASSPGFPKAGGSATQPGLNPSYPVSVTNYGNAGGTASPGSSGGNYRGSGGGGAGYSGTGPDGSSGNGHGGIGIQLPSTFHDPKSTVGVPGPGGGKHWVGGGGAGGSEAGGTTSTADGGVWGPSGRVSGGPYAGGGESGAGSMPNHWEPNPATLYHGQSGSANTGGGGGCGWWVSGSYGRQGGSGGSGIVLIAYPS